ncbi:hypothetical protein [Tolypothrix sp. PCC 7601]|uniref:hypothetical protein n=1 Tax=Tolypothrix sp. PCC 7601 TaxID=1188 RepID=UPI0021E0E654|nr:hypothetical protein [Tolypothrix sp. PCC 7601]
MNYDSKKNQYNQKIAIRAKELAQYLESAEAQEVLQTQRLHDLAATDLRDLIYKNGRKQTSSTLTQCPVDSDEAISTEEVSQTHQLNTSAIELGKIQAYSQEELWQ